ncbi:hypothetical protein ACHAWU_003384 [Discostella pseudostelligera]|uniref:Uncharacterized protein n=1 Tax=Discostella pseudostelligera TaxID=259834 RepID=A0ABD3MJI4_9STRA
MTMFMNRINVFQSLVHFWGSIFTCWFVLYTMKAETLWSIVGWTNVPTCLVELISMFFVYLRRKPTYHASVPSSHTHEA